MQVLVGVSLKMYFSHARTMEWVAEVGRILASHPARDRVEAFVMPQYPSILPCIEAETPLAVGAQDAAADEAGAYTGEVAAAVLAEIGCRYTEVGHAERRRLFGESDDVVAAKTSAAMRHGLTPVLCVGESDRVSSGEAVLNCVAQIDSALAIARESDNDHPFIVAYEPLWAIGAPEPASVEHIRAVCGALRDHVRDAGGRVIYGGSAGPGLLTKIGDDVDGLFLGRFAHEPEAMRAIFDEISG